jgi:nitrogen fixation/metabolism regulation signal transduction histidine kinase
LYEVCLNKPVDDKLMFLDDELSAQFLHDGPVALVRFDAEARCMFINRTAERLVGRVNGECTGKTLPEIVSLGRDLVLRCETVLREVMRQGVASRHEIVAPAVLGGGRFLVVVYPTVVGEGLSPAVLCVGLDVSYAASKRFLGAAEPPGGDRLIAVLAHELRNPLATIRSGLKIMELASGDQVDKARSLMERQLAHVIRLVNDLLDMARAQEGRLSFNKQPIILGDVISLALEMSSIPLKDGNHTLTISAPEKAIDLCGDPSRLAQVLSNLLDNASKYTPNVGSISLVVERDGGDVVMRVSDSGLGIPADRLSEIFQLFSQIDGHRPHSRGGLGIGLYLVKTIVEGHGGSVTAESPGEGRGAVFTVRLPAAQAA